MYISKKVIRMISINNKFKIGDQVSYTKFLYSGAEFSVKGKVIGFHYTELEGRSPNLLYIVNADTVREENMTKIGEEV